MNQLHGQGKQQSCWQGASKMKELPHLCTPFELAFQIGTVARDVQAGFQLLNLKNDILRNRGRYGEAIRLFHAYKFPQPMKHEVEVQSVWSLTYEPAFPNTQGSRSCTIQVPGVYPLSRKQTQVTDSTLCVFGAMENGILV